MYDDASNFTGINSFSLGAAGAGSHDAGAPPGTRGSTGLSQTTVQLPPPSL
jgi:hypothetical protein